MKNIIITGATSGIGRAVVEKFSNYDFQIFAGYRNEKLREEIVKISPKIIPFYIDMADNKSIRTASEFILGKIQKIDILVNVAGCVCAGPMEKIDIDNIRHQFEVNTFSHLEFSQKLFNNLDGGKIINISSESSFGFYPFIAPYCASKRALDILFNSLMLETHANIRVISIKPGAVKTPIWQKSISDNMENLCSCEGYEKEIELMVKNAKKSSIKGIEAEKVSNLVYKVANMKTPKPSYTIGVDAKIAEIFSHMPQEVINFVVKKALAARLANLS